MLENTRGPPEILIRCRPSGVSRLTSRWAQVMTISPARGCWSGCVFIHVTPIATNGNWWVLFLLYGAYRLAPADAMALGPKLGLGHFIEGPGTCRSPGQIWCSTLKTRVKLVQGEGKAGVDTSALLSARSPREP